MRWLWSLLIWTLLTTVTIATAGFAADGSPQGAPETFATAASQPGDRAVYKAALVVVEGDEGQWVDLNARYAFERVADQVVPGSVVARSFVHEWVSEPFEFFLGDHLVFEFPDCFDELSAGPAVSPSPGGPGGFDEEAFEAQMEAYADAWDDCADEIEDVADAYGERMEATFGQRLGAWGDSTHQVAASAWHVSHMDGDDVVATTYRLPDAPVSAASFVKGLPQATTWTLPVTSDAPCGATHSMQGTPVNMWSTVLVAGACPPRMDFGFAATAPLQGPVAMKVSGEDEVQGRDTTVFAHVDDPDQLRLWFADDIAYPVRILSQVDVVPPEFVQYANNGHPPRFYILQDLIEHDTGTPEAPPEAPVLGPVAGSRTPWGPFDGGAGHPWPLSVAYIQAAAAPDSAFGAWLIDHPKAAVDTARYMDDRWRFTVVDGDAGLIVDVQRTEHGPSHTATPFDASLRPDGQEQPQTLPSIASLAERHRALTGGATTGWDFTATCLQSCDDVHIRTTVGTRPLWGDDHVRLTVFDGDGTVQGQAQHPSPYPEPRFADDAWQPQDADGGWGWNIASAGIWTWPEPKTAAGVAAATGLLSLLYLLWPAFKGASAMPLFSRIRSEDLLQHPVRQGVFDAVETRPGIHFQEIVRQIEKGRGTTEHHLRKLVAAGLVVEKADRGFTCYFPKGKIDRRLMEAAPTLKSAGARNILQAVSVQPGAVTADVADRLGMATSTVNYHLKKLIAAGLIDTTRDGRFLALHPTALGDQALGTFRT